MLTDALRALDHRKLTRDLRPTQPGVRQKPETFCEAIAGKNLVYCRILPGQAESKRIGLPVLQIARALIGFHEAGGPGSGIRVIMKKLNAAYMAERLSPGGCADLLAAALLADRWTRD